MSYDAKKNHEEKQKNYNLIKKAHDIKPNSVSKKLLEQAEDDLEFAVDMLKKEKEDR